MRSVEFFKIFPDEHFVEDLFQYGLEKLDDEIDLACEFGGIDDWEWRLLHEKYIVLVLHIDNLIIENEDGFIFDYGGGVQIGYRFKPNFTLLSEVFLTPTVVNEFNVSSYYVPHAGSVSTLGFASACHGDSGIENSKDIVAFDDNNIDERIESLCQVIASTREWAEYESLRGGPYQYLRNQIVDVHNNSTISFTPNSDYIGKFIDKIKALYKEDKLPNVNSLSRLYKSNDYIYLLVDKIIQESSNDEVEDYREKNIISNIGLNGEGVSVKKMKTYIKRKSPLTKELYYRKGKWYKREIHVDEDLLVEGTNMAFATSLTNSLTKRVADYAKEHMTGQYYLDDIIEDLKHDKIYQKSPIETYPIDDTDQLLSLIINFSNTIKTESKELLPDENIDLLSKASYYIELSMENADFTSMMYILFDCHVEHFAITKFFESIDKLIEHLETANTEIYNIPSARAYDFLMFKLKRLKDEFYRQGGQYLVNSFDINIKHEQNTRMVSVKINQSVRINPTPDVVITNQVDSAIPYIPTNDETIEELLF